MPADKWRTVCLLNRRKLIMLRRRFMLALVPLVVLLLATVIGALWALQGVLGELRNVNLDDRSIAQLSSRFQWVVLGVGLAFLFVINVAVLVLLRVAGNVVRPVERLVHATHELGQE